MGHTVNETLSYVISLAEDVRQGDVPAAILATLIELGFQSYMDGFGYLRKAILFKCTNYDLRMSEVYQEVINQTTSALTNNQVEQAIYTAIDNAWKHRNKEKWNYFFSEQVTGTDKKPVNKEFISQIACIMELWCSHCKGVCYGDK